MVSSTLRTGTAADAPALLALWREADAVPSVTDDLDSIERLLAHDPGSVIVAEASGRLVGSVIAGWDGWRGSIYRLAVAPSHRRQGLAGRLVAAAEERLVRLGAVRLQAIVVAGEQQAVSFWGSTGWEQQNTRLRFVRSR